MGAIVTSDGAGFRVWAPHASAVAVKGSLNDWSDTANPLAGERNGYWYTFVAGVVAGTEYKYLITNGGQSLHRVDPYAFQVTNSVGNGVVYDHAVFDWQDDRFSCPPHNDLVIYELHVGSFAARRGPGGHIRRSPGAPPALPQAGGECDPVDASGRVRRGLFLGLQPGAHLRGRERLRRPGRAEDAWSEKRTRPASR